MISLKAAYQLRALVRATIQYAKESYPPRSSISSTKSTLGISVSLDSNSRTVNTYIGMSYIEICTNNDSWRSSTEEGRDTWGDDTMPTEWWGNGMMPTNPCTISMDAFEESLFQFEVLHSGTMPESSMYGLVFRAVLRDLFEDNMCLIIQRFPLGLCDVPIDPDNVNYLIGEVYYKHFGTTEVQYV